MSPPIETLLDLSALSSARHKKQKQKVLSREVKNLKLSLGVVGPSIKPIIFSRCPLSFLPPIHPHAALGKDLIPQPLHHSRSLVHLQIW